MEVNQFNHYTVMKNEAVGALNVNPNGIYIDATLGGGGHSFEIAKQLDSGKLIAIDRDEEAIRFARERLKEFDGKIYYLKDNYANIAEAVGNLNLDCNKIDGILKTYRSRQ